VVRADARTATNVTIVDRFPAGSVYVPTTDPPGVTRQAGTDTITWTILSLAPQSSNLLTVRFRKPTINPTTLATLTRKTWLPVTTK
jgi:hypothetical protein